MFRHGAKVVSDEDATLGSGDRKYIAIADPMQLRSMCGEEVDRGFAPCAAGDDGVTEAGVRQKADHALSRLQLASRARELLFQISRSGMRLAERILLALSSRQVSVHLRAVSKVEGDRAVDLLQRERGKG